MGLDNMPQIYPCKKNDTAVLDDEGRIDCEKTIANGMCPYHSIKNSTPLVKDIGGTLGMFGADCWYRGKYGNYLLNALAGWNIGFKEELENVSDFYGDIEENDETQGGISEDGCIKLSHLMSKYSEAWAQYVMSSNNYPSMDEQNHAINDWIYASWWLKFVGENAGGSAVWY